MHGEGHGYRRRSFTKTEKVEKLENCAEEPKKEPKTIEEKTKEMQR